MLNNKKSRFHKRNWRYPSKTIYTRICNTRQTITITINYVTLRQFSISLSPSDCFSLPLLLSHTSTESIWTTLYYGLIWCFIQQIPLSLQCKANIRCLRFFRFWHRYNLPSKTFRRQNLISKQMTNTCMYIYTYKRSNSAEKRKRER